LVVGSATFECRAREKDLFFEERKTVRFKLDGDDLSVTRQQQKWTVTWRGETAVGDELDHALASLTFRTRSATRALASRVMRAKPGDPVGPA
jgi:hypothetical protein